MESRLSRRHLFGLFAAGAALPFVPAAPPALASVVRVGDAVTIAGDDRQWVITAQTEINRRRSAIVSWAEAHPDIWQSHRSKMTNVWSPPRG